MLLFDLAAVNLSLFLGLVARYALRVGLHQAPNLIGGFTTAAELCRQIARRDPAMLVLPGHGENSIFDIYRCSDTVFRREAACRLLWAQQASAPTEKIFT